MEALPRYPHPPALSAKKTSAGTVQYEGQTRIGKGRDHTPSSLKDPFKERWEADGLRTLR